MKHFYKRFVITLVLFTFGSILFQSDARATSGFARKYGLACNTCHSSSFPRLNYYGEKFMRNGFQLPDTEDGSTIGKKAVADDLTLYNSVGDYVGVRGKVRIYENREDAAATLGSTIFGAFFASGTISKNMPFWLEFETNTGNGETELHNYFVGFTNVNGSSLANFRVGGFTPTEWTSFSDQKRALDAPNSHPGAFRPGKFSKTGNKPYNLRTLTGIEYYGYKGPGFWAVGVADQMGGNYHADHTANPYKDVYFVVRGEVPEGQAAGSSVSFLAYRANNGAPNDGTSDGEYTVFDLSGNLRMGRLDVFGAYVWDSDRNVATGTDKDKGLSIEGDIEIMPGCLGIVRFDTFDDGAKTSGDTKTSAVTPAFVYAPRQNLKVTASYTIDISDDTAGDFGERVNSFDVETQFMF